MNLFGREPALILGAIQAVIALAVGFGLNITSEQMGLIMAASAAVLALITRSQVTSTPAVNDLIKTAVAQPSGTPVEKVKEIQAEKDN